MHNKKKKKRLIKKKIKITDQVLQDYIIIITSLFSKIKK